MKTQKIYLTSLGPQNPDGSRYTTKREEIVTIHNSGAGPVCLRALFEYYNELLEYNPKGENPDRCMYLLTLER